MNAKLIPIVFLLLGSPCVILAQGSSSPPSPDIADPSFGTRDVVILDLRQRVARLEQELNRQVQERASVETSATNQVASHRSTCTSCSVTQDDQYPSIQFSGFLQFDAVWFGEPPDTKAVYGDIADSTAVRRARVAVHGNVQESVAYKIDFDFAASGHPSFRDTIVEFRERRIADRVVMGFFKAPISNWTP